MTNDFVLTENDFILKFIQGLHGFILNWNFLNFPDFYEKSPCKKKKVRESCLEEQQKSGTYLKMLWKKHKNLKAILAVLGHLKFKTFFVGQPWWLTSFRDLDHPPPPPPPPNYFSAATALNINIFSWKLLATLIINWLLSGATCHRIKRLPSPFDQIWRQGDKNLFFLVNWGKFGNAFKSFQKSKFPISFMHWEKFGNIHSPRPTFQNPNVESMDGLGKRMS